MNIAYVEMVRKCKRIKIIKREGCVGQIAEKKDEKKNENSEE